MNNERITDDSPAEGLGVLLMQPSQRLKNFAVVYICILVCVISFAVGCGDHQNKPATVYEDPDEPVPEELVLYNESDLDCEIAELYASIYPGEEWFYRIELSGSEYLMTAKEYGEDINTEKALTTEQVDTIRNLILTDKLYKIGEYYAVNNKYLIGDYRFPEENYYMTNILYSNGTELEIKWNDDKIQKLYCYLYSLSADLLTEEEFVQLMIDKYGMTDSDFYEFDYDDFIMHNSYTLAYEHIDSTNHDYIFERYKIDQEVKQNMAKFEKEIVSVPSTDEEYEIFVKDFLKKVTSRYTYDRGDNYGFDRYDIHIGVNSQLREQYHLYIGKTKNFDQYQFVDGVGYETCFLRYIIGGDPPGVFSQPFCYSKDGKFLLAVDYQGDPAYADKLFELFMD